MNDLAPLHPRPTTRAAEGLERWRWTLEDIERLVAAGVFRDSDRVELIGGELVPMSPKGHHHEHLRTQITKRLTFMVPRDLTVVSEPQLNLASDEYRQPDILVFAEPTRVYDVRGETALLVIEIADTSLAHDTGSKAATYARYGVREYWVIDALSRATIVFRDPDPATGTYRSRGMVPSSQPLKALLVSQIAIALDEID